MLCARHRADHCLHSNGLFAKKVKTVSLPYVNIFSSVEGCEAQSHCLQWMFNECDGMGKRRVCMVRRSSDDCAKPTDASFKYVCSLSGLKTKVPLWETDDEVCYDVVGISSACLRLESLHACRCTLESKQVVGCNGNLIAKSFSGSVVFSVVFNGVMCLSLILFPNN